MTGFNGPPNNGAIRSTWWHLQAPFGTVESLKSSNAGIGWFAIPKLYTEYCSILFSAGRKITLFRWEMKSWVPSPLEPIEHVLETCLQVHTTNCNNYLWSWKFDVGHLVTLWTLLFAVFRASQRRGGLTTGDQIFFWSTYVSVLGLKHYNIHYKRKKKF